MEITDENKQDQNKKVMRVGGFELKCVGGYQFDELTSAMQKCIRRSEEYEACFFAYVLHKSGYYKYVWKRLLIITSEDVGLANPMAINIIMNLKQSYDFCVESKNRQSLTAYTILFQAVMYLSRSFKTREADSLANLIEDEYTKNERRIPVPEHAIDPHTAVGKQMYGTWNSGTKEDIKKRYRTWVDVWAATTPDLTIDDKYMPRLKTLWGIADE